MSSRKIDDLVVVTYLSPTDGPVRALLTMDDARRHWSALPEPLRSSYSVRAAETADLEGDYQFTSGGI